MTSERALPDVPHPEPKVLDVADIYGDADIPNDTLLLEHFKKEGRVTTDAAKKIVHQVTEILKKEPNVLDIPAPVTIVGDIHGQFFDLVKLFTVGGDPSVTRYLFLGDYVDRGYFSLECVLYLWALKIKYPTTISMLRGNHECRHLTEYFTFKQEVEYKCSEEVYDICMNSFDCLPLAAIMNNQFFCVHGGLSPELLSVDDIQSVDRFAEPDETGLMCDLLWSDPHEDFDKYNGDTAFMHNETRGCSFVYTHKAACDFLDKNNLLSIIRAHEAQDQGYRMYKANPATGFPSVITIFSAPNYLDVYNNKAAVMIYADNAMNIKKFSHSPHPYWLPNFMDVFTWSLPFIGEKTTEMLVHVLNVCSSEELAQDDKELDALAEKMRNAMVAVNKTKEIYSDIHKSNEAALKLQGVASPTGDTQFDDIEAKMSSFEGVKDLDRSNEAKPTAKDVSRARKFRKRQTLDDIEL
eukprot:m.59092 g.59092  ORF g.59092 m.59092 type:complete len:466 (-) comp19071_c0_seq2:94-1491(-)